MAIQATLPQRPAVAETERERLWRSYGQLPPAERALMRLKALLGPPCGKHKFLAVLNGCGSRDPSGRPWSGQVVGPRLDGLRRRGLLDDNLGCAAELLHPVAVDAASSPDAPAMVAAIHGAFPLDHYLRYGPYHPQAMETLLRWYRLAVYAGDGAAYLGLRNQYDAVHSARSGPHLLVHLFAGTPVALEWLERRPLLVQLDIVSVKLALELSTGRPEPGFAPLAAHYAERQDEPALEPLRRLLVEHQLMTLNLARVERSVAASAQSDPQLHEMAGAMLALLAGRHREALDGFRRALKLRRQALRRRKIFLPDPYALFFLMALLKAEDAQLHPELQAAFDAIEAERPLERVRSQALRALFLLVQGQDDKAEKLLESLRADMPAEPLAAACVALAELLLDEQVARLQAEDTARRFAAIEAVLPLVARIQAEVLARVAVQPEPYRAWLDRSGQGVAFRFAELLTMRQPWERALDSLAGFLAIGTPAVPAAPAGADKRLVWLVDPDTGEIQALEQSAKARGGWTDGRPVAMKRLHGPDPKLTYLTEQDRRVLATITVERHGWYGDAEYAFDRYKALLALTGHPLVRDARDRSRPIELVAYPVELVVGERRGGFRITLSHSAPEPTAVLEPDGPGRYRVIDVSARVLAVQAVLGAKGLNLPAAARDRVVELVRAQNPTLPVRAETSVVEAPAVEGDPTPVLQLEPVEDGLRLRLLVRPFGSVGPYYLPGQGGASILAPLDGRQQRARRDLEAERAAAGALVGACPSFERLGADQHEWVVGDLELGLELLLELQGCGRPVRIEWPEGRSFQVSRPVAADRVSLAVSRSRDWLQIEGKVTVDEDLVLDMQDLLERLGRAHGRFVPLDDGRFVALTRQLEGQLRRLGQLSEPDKGRRRLPIYGSGEVEELLDQAGSVKADRHWRAFAARAREARAWEPAVPATLQAELRDYQREGYVWLSRLARWGAGACLADDMGLGKTVQAIAVLLELGGEGPSLVVAPTSVCHNWESELARFAPTLTAYRLGGTSAERAALVAALGPRDVLVASYGLLQQEEELLAGRDWRVALLDEAQAIKNPDSKRAQASQKLQAGFRLALTGTPIENYLDELWSLFNTINPGLLGTRQRFQQRFAGPIERDRDARARNTLRALIRPFLLRRTKAAVLAELPPRTEITLEVELPDEERAFYEALRRRAVESLAAMSEVQPGQRRIHILAEIGRLRRAAGHPGLVDPSTALPGAKLEAFLDLAEELIRNRHRALVFSQFIGQLDRVRAALDARGIAYQYLDGATPARERQRAVEAFQAGAGELFLISLKAGGVGLNLTAADYVIHLDPWWNPAVEDQASDRAHRIGQQRPVTIYRLIARGTIEEKIVALHKDKRDLAAGLLEGGEVAAKLSEDDLLALLAGEG